MFDFLGMADNYEDRKVGRHSEDGLAVSTAAVSDSDYPFETGIQCDEYNDGDWVIVENYDTREEAQQGHERWVAKMTSEERPEDLVDVGAAGTKKLADTFNTDGVSAWTYPRKVSQQIQVL